MHVVVRKLLHFALLHYALEKLLQFALKDYYILRWKFYYILRQCYYILVSITFCGVTNALSCMRWVRCYGVYDTMTAKGEKRAEEQFAILKTEGKIATSFGQGWFLELIYAQTFFLKIVVAWSSRAQSLIFCAAKFWRRSFIWIIAP